jgi:hypothetical protein
MGLEDFENLSNSHSSDSPWLNVWRFGLCVYLNGCETDHICPAHGKQIVPWPKHKTLVLVSSDRREAKLIVTN